MSALIRQLGGIRTATETHRVTTFELFFDLVFVFAVTQVTAFMVDQLSAVGVGQGLLLLGLLWWSWVGYSWLGNQSHADEGLIRWGMIIAAMAVFVVALAIPEAWADAPGGLDGPVALAGAYAVIRLVHIGLYIAAAQDDHHLRRQVVLSGVFLSFGAALFVIGAVLGGSWQTPIWVLALAVEVVGTYVTSRGGNWRLNSGAHWSERHALFVILALGESIVAIGVGASKVPMSALIIVAAGLGIALSVALWWLYFHEVARSAERALNAISGPQRVLMATEAFSYVHFPLVAGIVLSALGVEQVLAHADQVEAIGWFGSGALCVGLALYLATHAVFWWRIGNGWNVARLVAAVVFVGLWPVLALLAPLYALVIAVVLMWLLIGVEARVAGVRRISLSQ